MKTFARFVSSLRAFSFPASLIPSLSGSAAAAVLHRDDAAFVFSWPHALLCAAGCVLIHSYSNLANDYFDFKSGVDRDDNHGRKNALIRGTLSTEQMKHYMGALFVLALIPGIYFSVVVGLPVLMIVLAGAVSAYCYTAPPLQFKHRGLGELQVALSFGILIPLGSYIVQVGSQTTARDLLMCIAICLPQALLIAAILHANNHRDRLSDAASGLRTMSVRLSAGASVMMQFVLVSTAFLLLLVMTVILSKYFVVTVLALPQAIKVLRNMSKTEDPVDGAARLFVVDVANLQLAIGLLSIAAMVAQLLY